MERMARMAGALALAACLGGCARFGDTAQARINEALPPGSEVLANKSRLDATVKALALDPAPIEAEYAQRLQQRADTCAAGYAPSMFASAEHIRDALADKDCFVRVDGELQQWLGLRNAGLLLAAPPLRPIPAAPARLVPAAGFINRTTFADQAGVAVLDSRDKRELVDLGSGEVIRADEGKGITDALSPNGRLLTVRTDSAGMQVIDAEHGDLIVTLPISSGSVHWVGTVGMAYTPRPGDADQGVLTPVVVDLANGQRHRLPFNGNIEKVLPMPGRPNHFAVFSHARAGEFVLTASNAGWNVQLLSEQQTPAAAWERQTGVAPDGASVFTWSGALNLIALPSLQPRTVTLSPMRLSSVIATPDPDRLLLAGYFMGDPRGRQLYLYSLGQRTIALVDSTQLASGRVVYIAALKRNAVVDGVKLVLLDDLPAGQATDINAFLEPRTLAAEQMRAAMPSGSAAAIRERMLAQMQRDGSFDATEYARLLEAVKAERMGQGISRSPVAMPAALAGIGRNARIEAVGVYEGTGQPGSPRGSHRQGLVRVQVRRSDKPIILALSAYEPVRWQVALEPGAQLAAVLSGGYYPSEVTGAGAARVYQIGQVYAYKRGGEGYAELDAQVREWTGKPIDIFQGRYTGDNFAVGM